LKKIPRAPGKPGNLITPERNCFQVCQVVQTCWPAADWGDRVDGDLAALWSTAATTLVTLMTTDSWKRVKVGFAGLWRRARLGEARAVEADLEAARAAAVAARRDGDEEAMAELAAEWRSRLRRLAGSDEVLRAEVWRLVEDFRPLLSGGPADPVVMIARASGGSRVNQAGRDQTVTGL
jgi:hypothetical protein